MRASYSMNCGVLSSDAARYENFLSLRLPSERQPTITVDVPDFSDAVLYLASLARAALEDAHKNLECRSKTFSGFEKFSRCVMAMVDLPCSGKAAIAEKMQMTRAEVSNGYREVRLPESIRQLLLVSAQRDLIASVV